jgi:hypothetical protein
MAPAFSTVMSLVPRHLPLRIAALVVLVLSLLLTPETLPSITLCPVRAIFDVPCPGCGMTRAFTCIAHARFAEAWSYNPFSYLFFGLVLYALAGRVPSPRVAFGIVIAMCLWDLTRIFGTSVS